MMTGELIDREEQYVESALEIAGLDAAGGDADDAGGPHTPHGPADAAAAASPGECRSPSVCGSDVRALLPLMKEFDAREVRPAGGEQGGLGRAAEVAC